MSRRFSFVGVTTGNSSIMKMFPRWRAALDLGEDVEMHGYDLPVEAEAGQYQDTIREIAADPQNLGGLITTHKVNVYRAASDLFDSLDDYARLCGEISCVAKRNGGLFGWAKDPISAGRAIDGLLGAEHFLAGGGEALCMGAGGSGIAITLHLISREDRPKRIFVTDTRNERLEHLRRLCDRTDTEVEFVRVSRPADHDRLLESMPPRSLVVNATGLGKDLEGSPIRDVARFPEAAVVWELNYRGALDFLHQAEGQQRERALHLEDGWRYFVFGWASVIEEVFERSLTEDDLSLMEREASSVRSGAAG